jgi:MoaA/NifB/PqqE/SkfB family radical SAM enzyme
MVLFKEMKMNYHIDERFKEHFKNLHQVFVYIIDECNLECKQCIYKPNIKFSIGGKEIPFNELVNLITDFKEMGAKKLSILGGEPTLYGKDKNHQPLFDFIWLAKEIGYDYVRLVTNGTFNSQILYNENFSLLDEISFSLDGYDAKTNDTVRAPGVFVKAIDNIVIAKKLGYNVHITSCIYNELLQQEKNGDYLFERIINLAENLNVSTLNLHILVKDGTPIDTWSGDLYVNPNDWSEIYNNIQANIRQRKYKIDVRIPKLFIDKCEFDKKPHYYGYCPAKLGERILVHPNGILRICSGLLGTPYGVATYDGSHIKWNYGKTNELQDHKLNKLTPCTNRSKKEFKGLCPLCFSFKPNQKEYVWKNKLEWDYKGESFHHSLVKNNKNDSKN